MFASRPLSLAQLLARLTLVLAVPMVGLALAAGWLHVMGERQAMERAALADAREVLFRADGLVADAAAGLARLAAATREGQVADAMATHLAATGFHVALLDAEGRVSADTRPAGSPIAPAALAAARDRLVSPLVEDAASGGHALLIAAEAPEGRLLLALPARAFHAVLLGFGNRFDAARFPALADAEGRVVARWQDHDRFVGRVMPDTALRAAASPEGIWHGTNLTGLPVMVVHARSGATGLVTGVGVTADALAQPYWRSATVVGPAALGLALLAAAATRLVARRIGEPMASLAAAATLSDARPLRLSTPLREVNAAAAAMAEASERRQEAEAQRDLLVRELHHRVKNLLATAQSLAVLSARTTADPAAFAQQFGDRLRSLARTHTLLLEQPGGVVLLAELIAEVVAPYRLDFGRIAAQGPPVRLPPEAAVPLGMVLHELATNAAKYGALSVVEGRLTITWTVGAGPRPRLVLEWTERGGPPVAGPPARAGFGSQLLRRAFAGLPGGETTTEWRAEGLAVRLAMEVRESG